MAVFVALLIIAVISIAIQLASPRKDKYQRVMRTIFYRTPKAGKGAWSLGSWYYGDWDVGEGLNQSIADGQARYGQRQHRQRSHQPHHHHKHS